MAWTRQRITYTVAVAIVATNLVVGALLVRASSAPARPVSAATTPSPSPARSPQLLSPLTGEPVRSLGPVLAVQLDNDAAARPWTGLADADIVYVLPVEGGLSRLLAVFSSGFPAVIGPVRSARSEDLELLRQFGRPAFAYSGATAALLAHIHRTARIVDLYAGGSRGYYRDPSRAAPYNLYAHTRQLLAQSAGASKARGIGFRFGPPPPGGKVTRSASVSYPAASFRFTWSAARGRWLVSVDGAPAVTTGGVRLSAATVVIQHTTVLTSHFLENGVRPPYAESTGSGRAVVLRSGRAWTVHWSRPTSDGGTTFTTASGRRMTFASGQVWIVLAYP
jgi:Protein of unknown function (DUF3048) N-terminal domain/Protein of unknown function (DUF3048) C-terminal domain